MRRKWRRTLGWLLKTVLGRSDTLSTCFWYSSCLFHESVVPQGGGLPISSQCSIPLGKLFDLAPAKRQLTLGCLLGFVGLGSGTQLLTSSQGLIADPDEFKLKWGRKGKAVNSMVFIAPSFTLESPVFLLARSKGAIHYNRRKISSLQRLELQFLLNGNDVKVAPEYYTLKDKCRPLVLMLES